MADKRMTEEDVVARMRDGMTIGVGGWGSRRKPMSIIRAILRSDIKDLTVVAYGGPEVGLLCAAGKVKKLVYGFVTMDSIVLEPHFRRARQAGAIEVAEYDEGMFQWGLYAAAINLPFLPTRSGLGSAVMTHNPDLELVTSPYEDGEELLAVAALKLDMAFIHMNRGDAQGNGMYLGPDPYFDDIYCMAAKEAYMSVEKIVPTEELSQLGDLQRMKISRMMVNGVIEAPNGAHFTSCDGDYSRDEAFQREYNTAAKSDETWKAFYDTYLNVKNEAEYQERIAARKA